ncbi:hypothetical protein DL96DRAFT_1820217 [Flagelloscypha sp. PMI_526]|nr:hypothetical protein DL96DRAFT_1820217 [Flagelloscypha sp. PMI_526]
MLCIRRWSKEESLPKDAAPIPPLLKRDADGHWTFTRPPPILPLDIARNIFEYAALEDSKTALVLLRTAKTVHLWTGALFYRNITLTKSAQAPLLSSLLSRSNKLGSLIRTLKIDYNMALDYKPARIAEIRALIMHLPRLSLLSFKEASGLHEVTPLPTFGKGGKKLKYLHLDNLGPNSSFQLFDASSESPNSITHLSVNGVNLSYMSSTLSERLRFHRQHIPSMLTLTHISIQGPLSKDPGRLLSAGLVWNLQSHLIPSLPNSVQVCLLWDYPVVVGNGDPLPNDVVALLSGRLDSRILFASEKSWAWERDGEREPEWIKFIVVWPQERGHSVEMFGKGTGTVWEKADKVQQERRAWLAETTV